ncbi:MAG: hypothetical protein K2O00_05120 [Muribaculaceae bacterium]|nr:hypothetical protein [Muribaculaceae bacterium]
MKRLLLLPMLFCCLGLFASDTDSILIRMNCHAAEMPQFVEQFFANPALKYYSFDTPFSSISAGYRHRHDNQIIVPEEGDGASEKSFSAEGFMPAGNSSAVWGDAAYTAGKTCNVQWCESADPQIIYPYFTADATGGDFYTESYRFAGGYSRQLKPFTWGATLGYTASHQYRNVDPRPRNVTGKLTLSVGMAYSITTDYMLGTSLEWLKYKQSNEIKFVSETHEEPVYQLTGLGMHYFRFDGASKISDFSGNRYGAVLSLYPLHSGWLMNLMLHRFTFGKTLRDLNKLPLASVWHNSLELTAGYKHDANRFSYAVTAFFDASRRHGSEAIFGDATSGSYPLIGSLEMYADNRYKTGVRGLLSYSQGIRTYSLTAVCNYSHRKSSYAEPELHEIVEGVEGMAKISVRSLLGKKWYGGVGLTSYHFQSVTRCRTGLELNLARAMTDKYAIGIALAASICNYYGEARSNSYNIQINLNF